jgi:hypothetical protein
MSEMKNNSTDRTQLIYARLAGFMYFFNYITSMFGVLAPSSIAGSGDFAQKAQRVLASEELYRTALVSMAIGWVLIVFLAFALYVTLKPVNKRLAQLALFSELGQAAVGAVTVMLSFGTLWLYTAAPATGSFQNNQLQTLVSVTQNSAGSGFQISMMFLSVGSTLFFYLFYKSRYIPRLLAGFSVFASVLLFMVSTAVLIFPAYTRTILIGWAPMGVAEIVTAFWLMIRGIRRPPAEIQVGGRI